MAKFDPASIRQLRQALCLSQAKFAEKLGISRQHVAIMEAGTHSPTTRTLEKIMKIFGVEPEYFFTNPDSTQEQARKDL